MSYVPRVTELTRERIAREFDKRGPKACMAEVIQALERNNPELLDMASKWAVDMGSTAKIMHGFGMFYRLLMAESPSPAEEPSLNPLPRVTPDTRDLVVRQIDEKGSAAFTMESIEELEQNNPELLQLAHNFATRHRDYLGVMQGFALLYKSLIAQLAADRANLQ